MRTVETTRPRDEIALVTLNRPASLNAMNADLIVANSPFGVQMTKEVMWSQLEIGSLAAGIDLENRTQLLASTTGDMMEAVAAFMAKRPPHFQDQ